MASTDPAVADAAPLPLAPAPEVRLASVRAAWLAPALAWAPAGLCVATVLAPPLNHDVAAVLNFAERWLDGATLYGDLIDVNPPLIFALNLLPAAIGAVTPIGPVAALLLLVLGLVAGVAALCRRLRGAAPIEAAVLGLGIPLTLLAAGYDFAQREHLMLVAALPYCLLAARRMEGRPAGRRLTFGIAVLAALGFALKPHFLAIPALVEALVLATRGRAGLRDPVPWVLAAVWLGYLALIPLVFPAYLQKVLPLVWSLYRELGGFEWWQVLLTERLGTGLLAAIPLGVVAFAWPGAGAAARVLAVAAIGAAIAAAAQQKGWTYHALPVRLLAGLLGALLAARLLDRLLPPAGAVRHARTLAAAAAFGLLVHAWAGAEAPWRQITWSWSRAGAVSDLLRREAYGERLLVLSPDIFPVYPALNYARAQSTLRTMNLWLLQGAYATCPENGARFRETWEMSRTEFHVYRTVAEDFARAPPAALLVATDARIAPCGGVAFDPIAYFARHPAFAATLGRYRIAAAVEGYALYKRED